MLQHSLFNKKRGHALLTHFPKPSCNFRFLADHAAEQIGTSALQILSVPLSNGTALQPPTRGKRIFRDKGIRDGGRTSTSCSIISIAIIYHFPNSSVKISKCEFNASGVVFSMIQHDIFFLPGFSILVSWMHKLWKASYTEYSVFLLNVNTCSIRGDTINGKNVVCNTPGTQRHT